MTDCGWGECFSTYEKALIDGNGFDAMKQLIVCLASRPCWTAETHAHHRRRASDDNDDAVSSEGGAWDASLPADTHSKTI